MKTEMARVVVIASWRIIQKNGGVFRSDALSQHTGELLRKYWIGVSPSRFRGRDSDRISR
jgi:hypothetical protein